MKKGILFLAPLILFLSITAEGYASVSLPELQNSITKGKSYLKSNINLPGLTLPCYSGLPTSKCLFNGGVSPFVLYFVVAALMPDMSAEEKRRIRYFLKQNEVDGKYYYTKPAPLDLHDTVFAGHVKILLGDKVDVDALNYFYKPKLNAYCSFVSDDDIVPFATLRTADNDTGIHSEVSANLYNLFYKLHMPTKINTQVMKNFQEKEGGWLSYFREGEYYSTYMNMKLLCAVEPHSPAVDKGIQFLLQTQHEDHSWGYPANAYDTALAVLSLDDCRHAGPEAKNGIDYLLKHQDARGYWTYPKPIWLYPLPNHTLLGYDEKHVVTTGIVVMALRGYAVINEKRTAGKSL
jgi:hypothetical protein